MPIAGDYKEFAIDYWEEENASGDPDWSHFSNSREELELEAARPEMQRFRVAILYRRNGPPEWVEVERLRGEPEA
jgi:hypothetical protein